MGVKAGFDELLPLSVGLVCEGRVEDGLLQLRMQLKLNKELHNNPLLHGLIVHRIIALKERAYPAMIGFEHLNGIGGLDEVVIPAGIIVLHDVLLRHIDVKRPCSQSEEEARCAFGYTLYTPALCHTARGRRATSSV